MVAPEIHRDFQRLVRLVNSAMTSELTPESLNSARKRERFISIRLRRRGTTLTTVHSPVEMRIIRPQRPESPAPALLLIHGGGYLLGSARMDDRLASVFAQQLGVTVVSVEYRLAPEHPFPAGLDDCSRHWHGCTLNLGC